MDNPIAYARQLATYIASPTKIESLTRVEFGEAPPLRTIAEMRFAVERETKTFKRNARHWNKDSEARDGEDYVPPSFFKRPTPRAPRVTARIDFDPRPIEPHTNPFLQTWCLTRAVVASVATDFGLCAAHVAGKSRCRDYVWARAVAIRLLNECGLSAAGIGRKLDRDHSTILHALDSFPIYERQCEKVSASYLRHKALMAQAEASLAV